MSSRALRFYPGTPAVLCLSHDTSIDLQGLVEALVAKERCLVWLDSARSHPVTGRFSILGWDPWLTLSASGNRLSLATSASTRRTSDDPLEVLRQTLKRYPGPHGEHLPIGLGFFSVLSYELNRWIERLPHPKQSQMRVPELLLVGMRMLVVVDHAQDRSVCVSIVDPHQPWARAVREARARLEVFEDLHSSITSREAVAVPGGPGHPVTPTMSQAQFEAMVQGTQEYIKAGDIFQANLSQCFVAPWSGTPLPLYLALRVVNPSPFACFFSCPDFAIVSCSPERLIRVHHGQASARPIAGTRPRGTSPEEDLINSLELILSDKERAEHIMLVDLARNDLGRVCRFGTVAVDELMALEDYSHVIHIVSNVRGILRDQVDAVDVIRALFPGGTITGCPKVRCMEIIHELEPVARGLYTGSCGYIGFDGSLDFNILIRTIVLQRDRLWFHVGAGIVADSQPDREYHETLAKAAALLKALQVAPALAPSHALCP